MLYKGLLITAASGKLNGVVASHNRGGDYFRSLSYPTDPRSTQQLFMRAAMSDVNNAWSTMTEAERDAWNAYAATITITNRIGEKRTPTGRQAWAQWALPQYQQVEALDNGRTVSKTAPRFPIADFLQSPEVPLLTTTQLTLAWVDDGLWEGSSSADNGIIVHLGRAHSPLVNWYQGPFQPVFWLEGDEDDPVTSPHVFDIPAEYRPTVGQVLDIRVRLFREERPNGRVWQLRATCTA